ncbi:ferric reductase-like transmembrane domain-containing protein [Marinomonas sp. 15G1-11]|uniref:Ferric reductase-like transmembrane domain-containing protein n=1 Tax=Marinomonas phaeophyticola TaxID=3004091 RepID=A0ABT4K0A7_9GAMM|nr:ferric reductase-like transmembrane domain-containing protein [Marinomonas sp. 15G1-11]MCZ2723453.1 ferric reductase-like transmembrane domain-containing protein [Marinomonas sp. 15G1-11]
MSFQMKKILWLILSIPALGMIYGVMSGNALSGDLLHPSGEFSTRFMIIAMIATPLNLIFRKCGWSLTVPKWLLRHRRAFGVAAFVYAILHTLFYLIDVGALSTIMSDFIEIGIWTGWLAFLIFIPLGLTSNDASQRYLRSAWKKLQRWAYPAAVFTLLHWLFVHNNYGPALVHFVPLAILELFRIYCVYSEKSRKSAK